MSSKESLSETEQPAILASSDGPNFRAHGKEFRFAPRSLYLFREDNAFRQIVVWLIQWKWFDRFVIVLILANSATLAMVDYDLSAIDPETLSPDPNRSWRNKFQEATEPVFTVLFTLEMVLKLIGMGFFLDKGAYLRDGWNWLDFTVVMGGLLNSLPGVPKVSVLRIFRILRPLRSLTVLPGMRVLVISLLSSIPQLVNVVMLMAFVFFVFGILGIQLWSGSLHNRCRLTPYPVEVPAAHVEGNSTHQGLYFEASQRFWLGESEAVLSYFVSYTEAAQYVNALVNNRTAFPYCGVTDLGSAIPLDDKAWEQVSSPWVTPRMCVWPTYDDTISTCAQDDGSGKHKCGAWGSVQLTCGSNYDRFGNPRFAVQRVMDYAVWHTELSFGYNSFDWIGIGFLTIFQSITMEGWTDVMYNVQDTYQPAIVGLYFVILILFGSFFLLNLTLAVIWDNFNASQKKDDDDAAEKAALEKNKGDRRRSTLVAPKRPVRSSTARMSIVQAADAALAELAAEKQEATSEQADLNIRPIGQSVKYSTVFRHKQAIVIDIDDPKAFGNAMGSDGEQSDGHDATKAGDSLTQRLIAGTEATLWQSNSTDQRKIASAASSQSFSQRRNSSQPRPTTAERVARTPDSSPLAHESPIAGAQQSHVVHMMALPPNTPERSANRDRSPAQVLRPATLKTPAGKKKGKKCNKRKTSKPRPTTVRGWTHLCVDTSVFKMFIVALILMNTIVLALDQYPMDQGLADGLEIVNFLLSSIFTVEMVLKLYALGLKLYVKDAFNVFDAFIVCVSLVELVVSPPSFLAGTASEGGGAISALRTFRLFRVFKLARNWTSLRLLLATIVRTLKDVANFSVLLLLFMFIFALTGMEFFANRFHFHEKTGAALLPTMPGYGTTDEIPRSHFDDLFWGLVSIFQVLTVENWNAIMYNGWRARGIVGVLYFVVLVVLGNFIVLNLFLAILLGNFEGVGQKGDDDDSDSDDNASLVDTDSVVGSTGPVSRPGSPIIVSSRVLDSMMDPLTPMSDDREGGQSVVVHVDEPAEPKKPRALEPLRIASTPRATSKVTPAIGTAVSMRAMISHSLPGAMQQDDHSTLRLTTDNMSSESLTVLDSPAPRQSPAPPRPGTSAGAPKALSGQQYRAMFLFRPGGMVRNATEKIVRHPAFDNIVLALILISSLALAVDSPLMDPDSTIASILTIGDWIMTVLFTIEMMTKIVCHGFVLHPGSYLRSGWNVLDFAIVNVSIISLATDGNPAFRSLRTLRALRALRPLRMISRNPGLKLVVNALFRAIPAIINVMVVCMLFFLIFGIIGVNYFKGALNACSGHRFNTLSAPQVALVVYPQAFDSLSMEQRAWASGTYTEVTSRAVCTWLGADWEPVIQQDFNNIGGAMGALFQMSTTEMWVDIMHAGVSARGIEMQPIPNHTPAWALFFIGFMIVGGFFIMNLFVGVVIDNFNRMKEEMGDSVLLTEAQRDWVKTQEAMLQVKPVRKVQPPKARWRRRVFNIVQAGWFDIFIMSCIMLNTIVMAMSFHGQSTEYETFLENANYAFALVFTIEALMKGVCLGRRYFKDSWNRFDFLIVLGTNIGLLLKWTGGVDIGSIATIIRTFRIGRIFRLVKSAKSLRMLFNTLIVSLPSLANIGALLFLMFFIYSVMGVQLFSHVKFGSYLNRHANFRSFWTAMLTLVRASTGEDWNGIMYDLANTKGCTSDLEWNDPEPQGCGSAAAYLYMFSFTLLVTFVMLNVFIAVILERFGDMNEEESATLTKAQLEEFVGIWVELDPEATMFLPTEKLQLLFQHLPQPMGFGTYHASDSQLLQLIKRLKLPTYAGNQVHFTDVALACAMRAMGEIQQVDQNEFELPIDHKLSKKWTKLKGNAERDTTFDIQHFYGAMAVQSSFRCFKFRRHLAEHVFSPKPLLAIADQQLHSLDTAWRREELSTSPPPASAPAHSESESVPDRVGSQLEVVQFQNSSSSELQERSGDEKSDDP